MSDVENLLAAIKANFIQALPERIQLIENLVISRDPENYDELYRLVHSLKGNGATLGIPIISTVCHDFESYLSRMGNLLDNKEAVNIVLQYIDILNLIKDKLIDDEDNFDFILSMLSEIDNSRNKVIMTVELSRSEQEIVDNIAEQMSFDVVAFSDHLDAIEAIASGRYDVFITNYKNNDTNGVKLISAVKNISSNNINTTRYVLLTSANIDASEALVPDVVVYKNSDFIQSLRDFLNTI